MWFQMLLFLMLDLSAGYSSGPPLSVCQSMTPSHNVSAQSSSAPYSITLNSSSYCPNDVIEVTLSSTGSQFKGVFIQARNEESVISVGEFTVPDNDDHLRTMDCNSNNKSAVSHRLSKLSSTKTIYWRAPASSTGNITFVGTFVQVKSTYWIQVQSQQLTFIECNWTRTTTISPTNETETTTSSAPNTFSPSNGSGRTTNHKFPSFLIFLATVSRNIYTCP